ncbi:carboxypeptidase-like regulatory domain-containing protein [Formosa algae]|uniref:carboxypeptidase-like regulatory domain-containing protein n=1 Tax=Formosa algae TaxID=225843 RepID=UPI000CCE6592|nr:carboxypeptidase-like regulatory domain-containing protein [Formosa algae]PNW27033.1 hypothetical protein BKP44_14640 [Formosa algae]
MRKLMLLSIITLVLVSCQNDKYHKISGKVTDFNGHPLDSVTIRLKNKAFENMYETLSDEEGNYELTVKEDDYYCLYAIKLSEYRVNKLEYWTWNVPVYKDIIINPQYDRLEIYGINVFEPQVTPQETYMVYIRPMSLTKTLQFASEQKLNTEAFKSAKQAEELLNHSDKLINISPDRVFSEELEININGIKSEVLEIHKITEYARGFKMNGFIIQILKPDDSQNTDLKYDFISVKLHSKELNEIGKGEAFVRRIK